MTNTEAARAIEISDRRLNYLQSRGEDARNTAAWRDAVAERGQVNRAIAFSRWCAR